MDGRTFGKARRQLVGQRHETLLPLGQRIRKRHISLLLRRRTERARRNARMANELIGGVKEADDGRRTTDDGRRTTDDGRRTTDDGQRTTNDERRTTDDGQRTTDNG